MRVFAVASLVSRRDPILMKGDALPVIRTLLFVIGLIGAAGFAPGVAAISERNARRELAKHYFRSIGAATLGELARLFGWQAADARRAVDDLVSEGVLLSDIEIEYQPGSWFALAELCQSDQARS